MQISEKLQLLEDILELESGSLKPTDNLSEIEEYDSMSKLSLIVMMDEEFSKKLTGEQILKFITVQDILDFME
ncbi:MAG: acyl carrier protein [Bacteroides sp.]|nr:acyl carrier protein [Bacteroides sp.]